MAFQNGDINPLKAIFTGYKGESGTIVTGNDVDLLDKAGDVVKKYQMRVMDLSIAQKELENIQNAGSDKLAEHIDAVNIGTDSYKKYGNQAVFTGTGLKGLGTTLHAISTEVLKGIGSFVAMQLALMAISKIIEGAIYLYNKYSMSVKATAKRAEESAAALESTKTEIEELNKELDTMQERMTELRAIGSLSITEQEELTRLKLESSELQKQIKLLQERQKLEEKQLIKDNINAVKAIDKRHNITHTDEATGEEYEVNTDLRGEFEIRANRINQYHAALKTLSETDEHYQEKAQEYLDKIDEEEKAIADLSLQISEYKVALDDVPAAEKSYFEQLYKAENKALLATGTMSIMDFIGSSLSDAEFESFNNKVSDMAANFADASGKVTDIETRLKNLSTTEKDYIDNILPDFKLLSDEEIEKQFEKLEKGGNVKLALRPEIDTSLLAEKGWEDVGEGIATVFSSTYANEAGNIAANFTPILADENGKYIDVLSEESLQRYAEGVIAGVHDDYLNLQIGGEFTGTDAISQAEAAAKEIHKLQDYYYNGTSSQLYDALDAAGELDKVIDALAENEGISEIQSSFEDVISVLVNDVGYSTEEATDAILEHIRSMRNMGQVIENIANSDDEFSHITEKIDEITSTDFDIDTSSVTETLGSKFIDALDEAGVSVSDLCTWLDTLQEKIDNVTITDATTELADIEESLNDLSDAYYEFVDNNGKVSSATLKGLSESFEGLEDTNEFEQFIKVLGNSKSTLTEVQSAMNNLVDVYFLQQAVLGSLTEDNKALYVSQLQRLGVTNAEEVATQKIAVATIMALSAKDQLTDTEQKQLEAAQKVVNSLYSQDSALQTFANSTLTAAQKADLFRAQEEAIAGNKFSDIVTNHASVLALVAEAAGLGAEGVLEYASALELVDKYEKYMANPQGGSVSPNVASAYAKAKETIANRQSTIDQLHNLLIGGGGVTADYTPVPTSESKDKGKSQEDKNKEAYDDAKARLDNLLERNKISYREYYKKLTALGNKYLKGSKKNMREHYATLADVRRDAYDHYQEVLDKSLDNGSLTLRQYREKSKALAKEWLKGRVSNEQDYADAVEEIYDKLNEAWKDRISEMETQMERWTLDRTWDPDLDRVKVWQAELKQLDSDYRNGLFDSEEEYFDLRYDLLERIDEVTKESYDNELDLIEEKQDAIQELIDLTSDMLKQEKEDLIDALEDQLDVYEEICDKKRESLKIAKEENEYQRELEEENATLAELQAKAAVLALDDSRTGKAAYQEILKEIKEQQQTIADKQADHTYDASVDAIDKAEEAYKESIEKQVESINDLLDHAGKWLEYVYDYIKTTQPSELFKQLKDYNYQYGTGMSTDVEDIKKASSDLLTQFNSNIPEILKSLKNRQTEIEDSQKKTENKEDDTPSDNYKSKLSSSLSKQVQSSETKKNSNYQNRKLVTQIKKDTGFDSWYDEDLKVIYMGSEGDRRITAGAYNTIEKMRELNDSKGTKKEKESQMNTLLAQLQAKWSYKNAFLKWNGNKAQLWKTKNMQIFHDGLAEGFVKGDTYTPLPKKQKEVYALLQSNELVMNNRDQHMLLTKLSVLSTLTDSLKKMQLENVPNDLSSMNNITVEVNAPITIEGSADKDTIKELEKFKKNLSNDVLGEVTTAMKRRGYGANTAVNSRRK